MKRIHIFNPAAGGGHSPELLTKGAAAGEESYVTAGVGDAERFVYGVCREREEAHFVVYGGDGTLNEVVTGTVGFPNAAITVFAGGSGNDFIRMFDNPEAFTDLNQLLDAREEQLDLIRVNDDYAFNI